MDILVKSKNQTIWSICFENEKKTCHTLLGSPPQKALYLIYKLNFHNCCLLAVTTTLSLNPGEDWWRWVDENKESHFLLLLLSMFGQVFLPVLSDDDRFFFVSVFSPFCRHLWTLLWSRKGTFLLLLLFSRKQMESSSALVKQLSRWRWRRWWWRFGDKTRKQD